MRDLQRRALQTAPTVCSISPLERTDERSAGVLLTGRREEREPAGVRALAVPDAVARVPIVEQRRQAEAADEPGRRIRRARR